MVEWLRRLTRKPKVRTAVGSNPALTVSSLSVTLARVNQSHVREILSLRRVAAVGSCG